MSRFICHRLNGHFFHTQNHSLNTNLFNSACLDAFEWAFNLRLSFAEQLSSKHPAKQKKNKFIINVLYNLSFDCYRQSVGSLLVAVVSAVLLLRIVWHLGQFSNNLPIYCVHVVWLARLYPNKNQIKNEIRNWQCPRMYLIEKISFIRKTNSKRMQCIVNCRWGKFDAQFTVHEELVNFFLRKGFS